MKKWLLSFMICMISANAKTEKSTVEPQEFEKAAYEYTRTFAHVIHYVHDRHYDTRFLEDAMNKAIDAFLNTLDPHSNFLDPKTYKSMLESTNGEFFGVGIIIDNTRKPRDKYLTIIDTIPEGPADKAGILPLDKIIEIGGKPLEGMTTDQATALLKGERHTTVEVKVMREKEQDLLTFTAKRDLVKEHNSLSFYIKEHQIAYLSLTMFSHNAVKQIENLLKKSQHNGYKALILDLRNNSGGLLSAAVDIAGMFLPNNSLVVTTKDKHNAITASYKTRREPILTQKVVPIFILINNYTASAAEILAGCLQIHATHNKSNSLVFLVGTKTFGKGSVQEIIPVENKCAIKVTTSLYYLPNDVTIQGIGIEPDFVIERYLPPTEQMQWFTKYYGREEALTNAIKTHPENSQKKEHKKHISNRWIDRAKKMLETDNQLRETIGLINLFSTLRERFPHEFANRIKSVTLINQCRTTQEEFILDEITL